MRRKLSLITSPGEGNLGLKHGAYRKYKDDEVPHQHLRNDAQQDGLRSNELQGKHRHALGIVAW